VLDGAEIRKMIAAHDLKHDGQLSFDEFKEIFLPKDVEDPDRSQMKDSPSKTIG
jgi:hypothetical protein